jgi:putative PIN family toxin of toxin-antitoxin system
VLRAVVDVNVLISAVISQAEAPAGILAEWRAGAFELVVSPQLLAELDGVLARPQILSRAADAAAATRHLIQMNALLVDDPPPERIVPGDPDDDYLVALARAAGAQVIVTGDTDLLEGDVEPPALSPRDFLERLRRLA